MNSTAKRIYLIVLLVLATFGVRSWVQAQAKPREAILPDWTFREMPYELADWRGEDLKMDPVIAAATGADVIVDRNYRNSDGVTISMHTAVFKDPADGVLHTPLKCYRGGGWEKLEEMQDSLKISDDLTIPVSLIVWEKDHDKILVLYWYQVGDNVLFDRMDLGKLRIALRNRTKWPAMIKVMMQISVSNIDDAKSQILGFAEHVAKWENDPQHSEYFEETPQGE